jgi:hypothetical protein
VAILPLPVHNTLYLRALSNFTSLAEERILEAIDLLDQAIARDP